jgi:putative membrane protein
MTRLTLLASAALLAAAPAFAQPQPPAGGMTTTTPGTRGEAVNATQFIRMAEMSNRSEIAAARLAEQKSENAQVKQFARRMTQDHEQLGQNMQKVVQQLPASVTAGLNTGTATPGQTTSGPSSTTPGQAQGLDQKHTALLQQLQDARGRQFDQLYIRQQVQAHQEAVDLFSNYAQSGDNPQLKQLASQALPTLREHLQMAQQLERQVSGQG